MIKQNIFIINFDLLYEILDEIKENLSFNVLTYNNFEAFIKADHVNIESCLIILQHNKKTIFKEKLNEKNFFHLKDTPILLGRLVELININLIKLKYNYQSKIVIKNYEVNLNSKSLSKNTINLKLTEKEIELILYLNNNKNKNTVLDLQKNIWGYSPDMETHTVETHIYRLRKKISDRFSDDNLILSHKNGYFIN
tara:strand:- start:904 stop:1491 length:588 start_codon:yes stop_codon:yes gene_type:complete